MAYKPQASGRRTAEPEKDSELLRERLDPEGRDDDDEEDDEASCEKQHRLTPCLCEANALTNSEESVGFMTRLRKKREVATISSFTQSRFSLPCKERPYFRILLK